MSPLASAPATALDQQSRNFYRQALSLLDEHGLPYLVGGAYAFARYTGIERHTKDFDLFIRESDFPRIARAFHDAGFETDLTFPHWLGKAFQGDDFVDLIFSSGNGLARVDDLWFDHAVPGTVFDMEVLLIPAEEMIWSKGLIMERERFDGADVAHLLQAAGERLDWKRLLWRFGANWRPLYAHLVLFGYIYPAQRAKIPSWVMHELASRMEREIGDPSPEEKICFGTILSRQQYLMDVDGWGYRDARLQPLGRLTAEEIAHWTAGIDRDGHD